MPTSPADSRDERSPRRFRARGLRQRIDKKVRRRLRHLVLRLLGEPDPIVIDDLGDVQRILLIRTNFRIGNALISTPVIEAFRRRFPQARIDFLAADSARALFEHQPIDRCLTVSRRFIARPWLLIGLFRDLRSQRYDLAVQITPGSFSGYLVTRACRARYTMGVGASYRRWYGISVDGGAEHAYDTPQRFARALGVDCRDRPSYHVADEERARALDVLERCGIDGAPFVALFVGGHDDKRWPLASWRELCHGLDAAGIRFAVFVGPEEEAIRPRLEAIARECRHGVFVAPGPLRDFAAMLARARLLVGPDSGPTHLAAALDVPTLTIALDRVSRRFLPRGPDDAALWSPDADRVLATVRERVREIDAEVSP